MSGFWNTIWKEYGGQEASDLATKASKAIELVPKKVGDVASKVASKATDAASKVASKAGEALEMVDAKFWANPDPVAAVEPAVAETESALRQAVRTGKVAELRNINRQVLTEAMHDIPEFDGKVGALDLTSEEDLAEVMRIMRDQPWMDAQHLEEAAARQVVWDAEMEEADVMLEAGGAPYVRQGNTWLQRQSIELQEWVNPDRFGTEPRPAFRGLSETLDGTGVTPVEQELYERMSGSMPEDIEMMEMKTINLDAIRVPVGAEGKIPEPLEAPDVGPLAEGGEEFADLPTEAELNASRGASTGPLEGPLAGHDVGPDLDVAGAEELQDYIDRPWNMPEEFDVEEFGLGDVEMSRFGPQFSPEAEYGGMIESQMAKVPSLSEMASTVAESSWLPSMETVVAGMGGLLQMGVFTVLTMELTPLISAMVSGDWIHPGQREQLLFKQQFLDPTLGTYFQQLVAMQKHLKENPTYLWVQDNGWAGRTPAVHLFTNSPGGNPGYGGIMSGNPTVYQMNLPGTTGLWYRTRLVSVEGQKAGLLDDVPGMWLFLIPGMGDVPFYGNLPNQQKAGTGPKWREALPSEMPKPGFWYRVGLDGPLLSDTPEVARACVLANYATISRHLTKPDPTPPKIDQKPEPLYAATPPRHVFRDQSGNEVKIGDNLRYKSHTIEIFALWTAHDLDYASDKDDNFTMDLAHSHLVKPEETTAADEERLRKWLAKNEPTQEEVLRTATIDEPAVATVSQPATLEQQQTNAYIENLQDILRVVYTNPRKPVENVLKRQTKYVDELQDLSEDEARKRGADEYTINPATGNVARMVNIERPENDEEYITRLLEDIDQFSEPIRAKYSETMGPGWSEEQTRMFNSHEGATWERYQGEQEAYNNAMDQKRETRKAQKDLALKRRSLQQEWIREQQEGNVSKHERYEEWINQRITHYLGKREREQQAAWISEQQEKQKEKEKRHQDYLDAQPDFMDWLEKQMQREMRKQKILTDRMLYQEQFDDLYLQDQHTDSEYEADQDHGEPLEVLSEDEGEYDVVLPGSAPIKMPMRRRLPEDYAYGHYIPVYTEDDMRWDFVESWEWYSKTMQNSNTSEENPVAIVQKKYIWKPHYKVYDLLTEEEHKCAFALLDDDVFLKAQQELKDTGKKYIWETDAAKGIHLIEMVDVMSATLKLMKYDPAVVDELVDVDTFIHLFMVPRDEDKYLLTPEEVFDQEGDLGEAILSELIKLEGLTSKMQRVAEKPYEEKSFTGIYHRVFSLINPQLEALYKEARTRDLKPKMYHNPFQEKLVRDYAVTLPHDVNFGAALASPQKPKPELTDLPESEESETESDAPVEAEKPAPEAKKPTPEAKKPAPKFAGAATDIEMPDDSTDDEDELVVPPSVLNNPLPLPLPLHRPVKREPADSDDSIEPPMEGAALTEAQIKAEEDENNYLESLLEGMPPDRSIKPELPSFDSQTGSETKIQISWRDAEEIILPAVNTRMELVARLKKAKTATKEINKQLMDATTGEEADLFRRGVKTKGKRAKTWVAYCPYCAKTISSHKQSTKKHMITTTHHQQFTSAWQQHLIEKKTEELELEKRQLQFEAEAAKQAVAVAKQREYQAMLGQDEDFAAEDFPQRLPSIPEEPEAEKEPELPPPEVPKPLPADIVSDPVFDDGAASILLSEDLLSESEFAAPARKLPQRAGRPVTYNEEELFREADLGSEIDRTVISSVPDTPAGVDRPTNFVGLAADDQSDVPGLEHETNLITINTPVSLPAPQMERNPFEQPDVPEFPERARQADPPPPPPQAPVVQQEEKGFPFLGRILVAGLFLSTVFIISR